MEGRRRTGKVWPMITYFKAIQAIRGDELSVRGKNIHDFYKLIPIRRIEAASEYTFTSPFSFGIFELPLNTFNQ